MTPKKQTQAKKKTAAGNSKPEFQQVFAALKKILEPYSRTLRVIGDSPTGYSLETRDFLFRGKPLWCAGIRLGKSYVSYHFLMVYMNPGLLKGVSPALKKRMQGKSCFNFSSVDPGLFRELAALTAKGFASFDPKSLQQYEKRG
jgi:hypothetical protein